MQQINKYEKTSSKKWYIFVIIAIAFYLRFLGIDFNLPFLYDHTETIFMDRAFALHFSYEEGGIFSGLPMLSYLLMIVFGLVFIIGKIFGVFYTLYDFQTFYLLNPTIFYLLGRFIIGIVFGTGLIYVWYLLLKMVTNNERISLLSSFFLAFSYLHVSESHYIHSDIPFCFFVFLSLIYITRVVQHQVWKYFFLIGFLVGLTSSIKISGLVLLPVFFLVTFFQKQTSISKKTMVWFGSILVFTLSFVVFWASSPGMLNYFSKYSEVFIEKLSFDPQWFIVMYHILLDNLGYISLLLSFLGFLIVLCNIRKYHILVIFPICYFLLIYMGVRTADTYLIPFIPFIMFYISVPIIKLYLFLKKYNKYIANIIVFCLILSAFYHTAAKSVFIDYLFLQKDTKTIAWEWIVSSISKEKAIVIDTSANEYPKIPQTKLLLKEKLHYIDLNKSEFSLALEKKKNQLFIASNEYDKLPLYQVFYLGTQNISKVYYPIVDATLEAIQKKDISYLIASRVIKSEVYLLLRNSLKSHAHLELLISPYHNNSFVTHHCFSFLFSYKTALFKRKRLGDHIYIYRINK